MLEQNQENIKEINITNEIPSLKKIEPSNIVLPKVNENSKTNEQSITLPSWSIEPPIEITRSQK